MDLPIYDVLVARDLEDPALFDDLLGAGAYTGYYTDDIGYVLQFNRDLTLDEQKQVTDRLSSTPEQEVVIRQARSALQYLRNNVTGTQFANTTWTTAQLSQRVRTMGNILEGLIKLAVNDTDA